MSSRAAWFFHYLMLDPQASLSELNRAARESDEATITRKKVSRQWRRREMNMRQEMAELVRRGVAGGMTKADARRLALADMPTLADEVAGRCECGRKYEGERGTCECGLRWVQAPDPGWTEEANEARADLLRELLSVAPVPKLTGGDTTKLERFLLDWATR